MSPFALLQAGCLVVLALCLIAAGWQDLRTKRIANGFSLAIIAAFAVWALAGLALGRTSITGLAMATGCAAIVFLGGAFAFAVGALGGGDVKLLAAASLFAGPALLADLLIVTAMVGGALGLAILAGAPIGPAPIGPATATGNGTLRSRLRGDLPYGPAIAAGGLWVASLLVLS